MTHAQATASDRSIGDYIRDWRQHRRFSQLALALEIELSQKHLSFIESGRSSPSREVVLRIAAGLGVPLRIRNLMLLAAGYAPVYPERRLDHPDLAPARAAAAFADTRFQPRSTAIARYGSYALSTRPTAARAGARSGWSSRRSG